MSNVISNDCKIYEPRIGTLTHQLFYYGDSTVKNEIIIYRANHSMTSGELVFKGNLAELIKMLEWHGVTA